MSAGSGPGISVLQGGEDVKLFLLPELNVELRPLLLEQLDPGTPIVSHEHRMGDWEPDTSTTVEGEHRSHDIHAWIVPAGMDGDWRPTMENAPIDSLSLSQSFQRLEGSLRIDGERIVIDSGTIVGRGFLVTATGPAEKAIRFSGQISGDHLTGSLTRGEQRSSKITLQLQSEP